MNLASSLEPVDESGLTMMEEDQSGGEFCWSEGPAKKQQCLIEPAKDKDDTSELTQEDARPLPAETEQAVEHNVCGQEQKANKK